MSGRYHIPTAPAPAPFAYPAAFHLLEHDDYVKYGHTVFEGRSARGDTHWTAEVITQTWYQAETGRIPISGAGYGGPFAGEGFDGIWLDMSEIVRPTRDGIHGRETISTTVDLGRRLSALFFDDAGRLTSALPSGLQLPLPVLFNPLPEPLPGRGAVRGLVAAAARLGTLALITPDEWDEGGSAELAEALVDHASAVAFRLTPDQLDADLPEPFGGTGHEVRFVEIEVDSQTLRVFRNPKGFLR